MFKKFYIYIGILSLCASFIFSFSINPQTVYFYPIKNNSIISSFYGIRTLYGKYNFHNGIDIPCVAGTNVFCITSGVVSYIGFDHDGYGNYIIILHKNSYKSLYGHLSEAPLVKLGDYVNSNQIISHIGPKILSNEKPNGNTTGSHLHFSIYDNLGNTIDPLLLEYKK